MALRLWTKVWYGHLIDVANWRVSCQVKAEWKLCTMLRPLSTETSTGSDGGSGISYLNDTGGCVDDHVSLVQGASRGLGLEFVRQLLGNSKECTGRTGGRVIATCRNPASAAELTALAQRFPDRLIVLPLDVTQPQSIKAAAAEVARTAGSLHLLLNVTGVLHTPEGLFPETSLSKVEPENLLYSYQVNAIGPTLVTKEFAPLLTKTAGSSGNSPWPVVVANLSARVSSVGDNRLGGWFSYRASKCALNQLTKTAAIEFARRRHPVTCILLHPGTANTGLSEPFQKNVPADKLFTKERTIEQLLSIIEEVNPADNGTFFAWDKQVIPW